MLAIEKEAETRPDLLLSAPHNTPVGRLDEGMAARDLNVRYDFKTTP
jgi:glycine dehydrogenase subunit 2